MLMSLLDMYVADRPLLMDFSRNFTSGGEGVCAVDDGDGECCWWGVGGVLCSLDGTVVSAMSVASLLLTGGHLLSSDFSGGSVVQFMFTSLLCMELVDVCCCLCCGSNC